MTDIETIEKNLKIIEPIRNAAIQSFDDAFKTLSKLLVTLNGGGLVASLAFIGAIINDSVTHPACNLLCFSAFLFGFGIVFSTGLAICNFFYFKAAVNKYICAIIKKDTEKLTKQLLTLDSLLSELSELTKVQKLLQVIMNIFLACAFLLFVIGFIKGFIGLFYILKLR